MAKLGIAIQLYTLREEMNRDFVGTLRKVAELGYEGVEFAGYGDLDPYELKQLLLELNLKPVGSHVSVDRLSNHLEEEVEYNRILGTQYVVCPYLIESQRNEEFVKTELIDLLAVSSQVCANAGIGFAYHNHDFEFRIQIENQLLLDAIFSQTPVETVQVELDVCWVQYGGYSPLEYIHKYQNRLPLLHLKDMKIGPDGRIETVELGEGVVDLPSVIQASEAAGVKWLVVEQDDCKRLPLESIQMSMNWLKTHYLF